MKLKFKMLFALQAVGGMLYAQSNSFLLNGKINNLKDGDQVHVVYRTIKITDTISSAIVKDGSFQLKGSVATPTFVQLRTDRQEAIPFFIENTEMNVTGNEFSTAVIKGGKANAEYKAIDEALKANIIEMRKVGPLMEKAYANKDEGQVAVLLKKIEDLQVLRIQLARDFAIANPNSFVSPAVILNTETYDLDPTVYQPIYANFSNEVKSGIAARTIKERIDAILKLDVGSKAPNLIAKTPEGTQIELAEIIKKGDLTLVDFWASWCGPCRREGAKILELHKKYHSKGFNVLGVSLDHKSDLWKKAIADDKTDWYHISDLKQGSDLAAAYGVIKIPATYLIDKHGRIIAKNAEVEEIASILEATLNK